MDLVLVDAAPGVLAWSVQYNEDGGPDERPPSIKIFRPFLALLRLEAVGVAHLHDSKETAEDVGPTPVTMQTLNYLRPRFLRRANVLPTLPCASKWPSQGNCGGEK